jgi:hypothetical protein
MDAPEKAFVYASIDLQIKAEKQAQSRMKK